MKITEITIRIDPNSDYEKEVDPEPVILHRNKDKQWSIHNKDRGMFPYEIRLADNLQKFIIDAFNGGGDKYGT